MKKSLVLISFAFIFLLSVSLVSANFFDWITGGASKETKGGGNIQYRVAEGRTAEIGDLNVEVVSVKEGVAKIEVNGENIEVREGRTATLSDGTVLTALDVKPKSLFRKAFTEIKIDSSTATKGTSISLCNNLVEGKTTKVVEGVKTRVDGHNVLIEGSIITIDNQFSASLPSGRIEVPIPSDYYWEVTPRDGDTFTFTTKLYIQDSTREKINCQNICMEVPLEQYESCMADCEGANSPTK